MILELQKKEKESKLKKKACFLHPVVVPTMTEQAPPLELVLFNPEGLMRIGGC